MMYAFAVAGVINVITTKMFLFTEYGGRFGLDFGTISNSNDLAAHLLLVLPFILFVVIRKGGAKLPRIALAGAFVFGLYQTLGTGSRGALIALAVSVLIYLVTARTRQRMAALVVAPLLGT